MIPMHEEEEEEEDEELGAVSNIAATILTPTAATKKSSFESKLFKDSVEQIEKNQDDVDAWNNYLTEAINEQSGTTTLVAAYEEYLKRFPRSNKAWSQYGKDRT